MKILFVCENYIPHYGGAEVVFKNLAEGFVNLGHSVSIITHHMKRTKKKEVIEGVRVFRIPSFYSRYIFTFSSILQSIKEARKHDIIQTTTFNGAFPAWIAGKLTRKPVVLTVHEIWIGKWESICGFGQFKTMLHEFLERCIYLLPFDRYVCVSNATARDLHKIGIKSNKITQIYNGLDYEYWKKSPEKSNSKPEFLKPSDKMIFSWGRPGPSKGFEFLIKAFPKIVENIPSAKLVLCFGSKEQYQENYNKLMSMIHQSEVVNKIVVLHSTPREKLKGFILAADLVVIPSVSEGFGYTTVETVALDTPILVSDAGSLPEVVSGRYRIFKKKDVRDLELHAIAMLQGKYLTKPKKIFQWDTSISNYITVYETCLRKISKS